MLKELLSLFRSDHALRAMTDDFLTMLDTVHGMVGRAGVVYFGEDSAAEERTALYKTDITVNKLERGIRKRIISYLTVQGTAADLPHCLLLMSLVKDAERIGDYAKNIIEVRELHVDALPDTDLLAELREIRTTVDSTMAEVAKVFKESNRNRAIELITAGRTITQRADTLLQRISRSSEPAPVVTALVLGTRYYKRAAGHVLNILSGIVMPLHKLDYYDEEELEE